MNRLAIIGKITFVLLFTLFGVISGVNAQSLSGSGTSSNPYLISSAADWNTFVADVNGGYSYSGKIIQLAADIPTDDEIYEGTPAVTTMVGVWDATETNRKPFSGTFKGDGKTIIVDYSNSTPGNYTAPFVCTNGATITNDLTIVGNIDATTGGYAAGLIGKNYGDKTKVNSNVSVKVNIIGGGDYCAGIAVDGTNVEMSSCVYSGQIVAGSNSAGFCATGASTTKFNNCLFAPAEGSSITGGENFINGDYGYSSRYYYTYPTPVVSSTQGSCVYESYSDIPNDGNFRVRYQLYDNNYYYVQGTGTISGLKAQYYQSNAQGGGINYDVTFTGHPVESSAVIVDPECYIAEIIDGDGNVVNVSTIEIGTFTLRITGNDGYCKGTLSQSFEVEKNVFDNGSGTEDDPYQISSTAEWNAFANAVNGGYTFAGEFLKLTSNIDIIINNTILSDKMVGELKGGNESKWFSGTFDGDDHTLTFNAGLTEAYNPAKGVPTAPFRVIDGATIKNLTVTGTIFSNKKYNSGLVGFSYNTKSGNENNIINCTSNIVVDCTNITADSYDCSSAGFLAENKQGKISFKYCVFTGTIDKGNNQGSTQKSAGFVSFNGGSTVTFDHCTMAGIINLTTNKATFYREKSGNYARYYDAYYFKKYNDYSNGAQGTEATPDEPTDDIAKKYNVSVGTYYVPGSVITGLEETMFQYTGNDITITPLVEYYGRTLTTNDYNIKIEKKNGSGVYETVDAIRDAGDYHYIIYGVDSYGGSLTTDIKVLQLNSWAALIEAMKQSKGTFDLTQDIIAKNPLTTDTTIWVSGNITLNMNGYTIDRNLYGGDKVVYGQVIRVMKGASLTINGKNGTITGGHSWPGPETVPDQKVYYGKRDAGGIHNMGDLVLNDVNVVNNKCEKGTSGAYIYSARGGGVYSGPGSSLVIEGGSVSTNEGPGGGCGVYCNGANPFIMTGVDVEYNSGDSKGGGIRIFTKGGAIAYLTDCHININSVNEDASQGGGIYLEGGELVMTRCEIAGNAATMQGAGFFSYKGKTTAIDCDIYWNGSFYESVFNHGAGIYLNDNKGSNHSIYIMDGGSVYENQCINDGGGVYVADGAVFQIKGDVYIKDNVSAWIGQMPTNNNAYMAGESVIEVIDNLGENAIIYIVPNSSGARTYVIVADGISSAETMKHFAVDADGYYKIIDENGNIEVYEPYSWNETTTWNVAIAENSTGYETIPTEESNLEIHRVLMIPSNYVAYAKSISIDDYCIIIIEDGGELINSSANVDVLSKKNIVAADADEGTGWYLISSMVANPSIADNTNLITESSYNPTYDLYRFNEAATLQWENYRNSSHDDFTTLQSGRGYLYRNKNDYTIEIDGTNNVSSVEYTLSYVAHNALKGFNLIGNPYSHTIYKGVGGSAIPNGDLLEGKYYVLNSAKGEWILTDDGTAIPPMTGIMVQAQKAGTLTMVNSTEGASSSKDSKDKNIWFTVSNSKYEDKACVEFKDGRGLNKIAHENEDVQMLYIRHNDEDFACVDMDEETNLFNLNFEAKTMGFYTMTMNVEGSFGYLHLIDKVANKDIDMLQEKEYSFVGSPSDSEARFIVSLSPSTPSTGSGAFAFQNGDDIIVNGNGELQVFDVTGRLVMAQHVTGVEIVRKPSQTGVYVFRLEGKTQKIVVR